MELSLTDEELRITRMALWDYINDPWDERARNEHDHAVSAYKKLVEVIDDHKK